MAVRFTGAHFPQDLILTAVRWYVAYPLRTRHVEELRRECGVPVDPVWPKYPNALLYHRLCLHHDARFSLNFITL
jgi:hypothetical protein